MKGPPNSGRNGVFQHVQPARIGAEGRHHAAPPIRHEAPPPHRAPAQAHLAGRMQVPGDLRRGFSGVGLVPQHDAAERQHLAHGPAQLRRRLRVVVAAQPDPVAAPLQSRPATRDPRRDARDGPAVVQAVAEHDHGARTVSRQHDRQRRQRGALNRRAAASCRARRRPNPSPNAGRPPAARHPRRGRARPRGPR